MRLCLPMCSLNPCINVTSGGQSYSFCILWPRRKREQLLVLYTYFKSPTECMTDLDMTGRGQQKLLYSAAPL